MRFKEFKNKKITIMGLGLHGGGLGSAIFFAKQGAKIVITDLKKKEELKESLIKLRKFKNIKYILGKHRIKDFLDADLVIKNPSVPQSSKYLKIAKNNKTPIDTDIGIFFELCPAKIIGITGSKGKSTTAALIAEVLEKKRQNVFLAGNIRISVLDILPQIKKQDLIVLELSSWQLEGLVQHKKSPHISIITNIYKEHLDRYNNSKDYIEAKKNIFKFQDKKDYLIVNKSLKRIVQKANSQIILFDGSSRAAAGIIGKIYKIPEKNIKKAVQEFKGLEGRLEFVKEINGVKYYNDTCATHPEAVIYALKKLNNNIILIAGGADKNLDFTKLNKFLDKKIKILVLLPGTASKKIKTMKKTIRVRKMKEAVLTARKTAKPGDIVLLSPGCASFGLFRHEFERGEQFKKYIKN